MTPIAANITKRREELGIAQADLARLAGVSAATMSRWESGASVPTQNNLGRLATALKTTASWIHGDSERPADIDADLLALAIERLEQALGDRFAGLSASQKAKLLVYVYSRKAQVTPADAVALFGLVA